MKPIAKKKPPVVVNFKVSEEEHAKIVENARKFAHGNISLWLRHVGAKDYGTPKAKKRK